MKKHDRNILMKSVIIAMGVFFLTYSAWAGTFLETFDEENLEAWRELIWLDIDIGEASWEITGGELHGFVPLGIARLFTMGDERWRDYIIEFDVKPLKKHGPGNIAIAARVKESWAVWCMIGDQIRNANNGILRGRESRATCFSGNFHIKDQIQTLASTPSPLLKLNKWSMLKLSVKKDVLTFWINDKDILGPVVLELPDELPPLLTGGIGLGLGGYTAHFDNISITGDTVLDNGGFSVEAGLKLTTTWGKLKR